MSEEIPALSNYYLVSYSKDIVLIEFYFVDSPAKERERKTTLIKKIAFPQAEFRSFVAGLRLNDPPAPTRFDTGSQ